MSDLVLRDLNDGILRLTLNDPATRNSLSEMMIQELRAALDGPNARVIILAAHGPAFSSGHNLKEITARRADADGGSAYFKNLFDSCADLMLAIMNHPCPVIAEIDGLASAAGCQLVASCDLAIATDRSSFCTPGVNIGARGAAQACHGNVAYRRRYSGNGSNAHGVDQPHYHPQ
jgi:enoyl-CoA hydratase/carnithine racemase